MKRIVASAGVWLLWAALAWGANGGASDAEVMERGEVAIREADWKGAEAAFREAVRRTPKVAKPHRGLGIALLNQGKVDEGLATLQRSVAIEDSASARYNIGFAYGKKGDHAKAAESFRLAVTLTPDYPLGWTYLVDALARSDRHDEALDTVKEARAKCAKCKAGTEFTRSLRPLALHHHNHAARLFAQGKLDLAEGGETVVLSIDPSFADAHYNLGRIAAARGKPEAAEAMYRKALVYYGPEEAQLAADAKNNLAFAIVARGGGREAVTLVREAIAVRGERASYLDTLGRACEAVKDRACAREAYRKLVGAEGVPAEVAARAKERLAKLGR